MTDGIIQKVFRDFNWQYQSNPRWNRRFAEELQQELIEKIKQELESYSKDSVIHHILKKNLIGDNQE